jgi:hypothetical protein
MRDANGLVRSITNQGTFLLPPIPHDQRAFSALWKPRPEWGMLAPPSWTSPQPTLRGLDARRPDRGWMATKASTALDLYACLAHLICTE